jgi:hypothetical protein
MLIIHDLKDNHFRGEYQLGNIFRLTHLLLLPGKRLYYRIIMC